MASKIPADYYILGHEYMPIEKEKKSFFRTLTKKDKKQPKPIPAGTLLVKSDKQIDGGLDVFKILLGESNSKESSVTCKESSVSVLTAEEYELLAAIHACDTRLEVFNDRSWLKEGLELRLKDQVKTCDYPTPGVLLEKGPLKDKPGIWFTIQVSKGRGSQQEISVSLENIRGWPTERDNSPRHDKKIPTAHGRPNALFSAELAAKVGSQKNKLGGRVRYNSQSNLVDLEDHESPGASNFGRPPQQENKTKLGRWKSAENLLDEPIKRTSSGSDKYSERLELPGPKERTGETANNSQSKTNENLQDPASRHHPGEDSQSYSSTNQYPANVSCSVRLRTKDHQESNQNSAIALKPTKVDKKDVQRGHGLPEKSHYNSNTTPSIRKPARDHQQSVPNSTLRDVGQPKNETKSRHTGQCYQLPSCQKKLSSQNPPGPKSGHNWERSHGPAEDDETVDFPHLASPETSIKKTQTYRVDHSVDDEADKTHDQEQEMTEPPYVNWDHYRSQDSPTEAVENSVDNDSDGSEICIHDDFYSNDVPGQERDVIPCISYEEDDVGPGHQETGNEPIYVNVNQPIQVNNGNGSDCVLPPATECQAGDVNAPIQDHEQAAAVAPDDAKKEEELYGLFSPHGFCDDHDPMFAQSQRMLMDPNHDYERIGFPVDPEDIFDLTYPLDPSQKYTGTCLIIDQFTHDRKGSYQDVQSIVETFQKIFKFRTDYQCNLSKRDFISAFKKHCDFMANPENKVQRFVSFILGHGDEEGILTCVPINGAGSRNHQQYCQYEEEPGARVDINKDLLHMFSSSNLKAMAGLPKLMFIQACRGHGFQGGAIQTDADSDPQQQAESSKDYMVPPPRVTIPNDADVLLAFAQSPGNQAFRDPKKGSWFIQAVADIFRDYHERYDVVSMMTMVSHAVSLMSRPNSDGSVHKESPTIQHTFRKRMFMMKMSA